MTFLPRHFDRWPAWRRVAWWAVQIMMLPGFVVALPGMVWVGVWAWVQDRVEEGR